MSACERHPFFLLKHVYTDLHMQHIPFYFNFFPHLVLLVVLVQCERKFFGFDFCRGGDKEELNKVD